MEIDLLNIGPVDVRRILSDFITEKLPEDIRLLFQRVHFTNKQVQDIAWDILYNLYHHEKANYEGDYASFQKRQLDKILACLKEGADLTKIFIPIRNHREGDTSWSDDISGQCVLERMDCGWLSKKVQVMVALIHSKKSARSIWQNFPVELWRILSLFL